MKKITCPKCSSSKLRAGVDQTVDIIINADGTVFAGNNFSDPEINRDFIYCEECGSEISIEVENNKYKLSIGKI